MAVLDHPVHDKVKIGADFKYGCNSRKSFADGYYAPDRVYKPDGTFYIIQSFVKRAMSDKCRNFYLWDTDNACRGCTTEKDIDYALTMQKL